MTTTPARPGPKLADHAHMMRLVEQLSPATRARIARGMDDRFHEITGAPRDPDCCDTDHGLSCDDLRAAASPDATGGA